MNTLTGKVKAGLLALAVGAGIGTYPVYAQQAVDVLVKPKLAGTFQRFDLSARTARISDIEYSVSPRVKFPRGLRAGESIVFQVEGHDPKGRDVIVEIAEK